MERFEVKSFEEVSLIINGLEKVLTIPLYKYNDTAKAILEKFNKKFDGYSESFPVEISIEYDYLRPFHNILKTYYGTLADNNTNREKFVILDELKTRIRNMIK